MQKVYEPSGGVLFGEKQHFPRWLLVLMISPALVSLGVILAVGMGKEGYRDVWIPLLIILPIEVLMFWLFYTVQLEKEVTTNGLYYRWTPLQKKFRVIEKQDIQSMELRKAPSMKYGSHRMPGYGRVHNVSDGEGVQLDLSNGKKIFFGTADKLSFYRAMEQLRSSNLQSRLREF